MIVEILKQIRPAVSMLVVWTGLAGLAYPAFVTYTGQVIFPRQAGGSMIVGKDGKVLGSELIGQPFSDPKYFWSRPSATSPMAYNAQSSSGSNLGPLNSALTDAIKQRVQALRDANKGNTTPVPVDLVTASASGLDPHITPAAAEFQVERVAKVRHLSPDAVRKLVVDNTTERIVGLLGEPCVNVLKLNLALDAAPPVELSATTPTAK
jgi:K+-transporting ATPase ATPase C chain